MEAAAVAPQDITSHHPLLGKISFDSITANYTIRQDLKATKTLALLVSSLFVLSTIKGQPHWMRAISLFLFPSLFFILVCPYSFISFSEHLFTPFSDNLSHFRAIYYIVFLAGGGLSRPGLHRWICKTMPKDIPSTFLPSCSYACVFVCVFSESLWNPLLIPCICNAPSKCMQAMWWQDIHIIYNVESL